LRLKIGGALLTSHVAAVRLRQRTKATADCASYELALALALGFAGTSLDVGKHLLRTSLLSGLHLSETASDLTLGLDALLLADELTSRSLARGAHGCRLLRLLANASALVFECGLRSGSPALGHILDATKCRLLCGASLVEPERIADVAGRDGRCDGSDKAGNATAKRKTGTGDRASGLGKRRRLGLLGAILSHQFFE
jgi:hypothetical protein